MKCDICGYDRNEKLHSFFLAERQMQICFTCEVQLESYVKKLDNDGFRDRVQDRVQDRGYEMQQEMKDSK